MSTTAAIVAAVLNIAVASVLLWGWLRDKKRALAIELGVARLRVGTEDIALRVRPGWVLFVRTLSGAAREAYVLDDPRASPATIAARLVRQRADLDGGLRGEPDPEAGAAGARATAALPGVP